MSVFYFYKITNLKNNRYYYGVHATDNIDDGYMGSGVALRKAIIEDGIANFKKEILKYFDTREEMYFYEATVVTQDLVDNENCYNLTTGGGGARFYPYGLTAVKDKEGKRFLCNVNDPNFLNGDYVSLHKNQLLCKDKNGTYISVDKDDIRVKNGELLPFSTKMRTVEDIEGNRFYVSIDDERIKSGELFSINKGYFTATDKDGNIFYITKNDERYKQGELWGILKNHTIINDNGVNRIITTEEFKHGKYNHVNKGKVLVVDKDGKYYMVDKNDNRYKKGELIHGTKGKKVVTNGFYTLQIPVEEYIEGYHGVILGKMSIVDKDGNTFMCDKTDERIKSGELVSTNKGKFLCVDKDGKIYFTTKNDERYINGDIVAYSKGRKYDKNHSEKLRLARGKRITINNGENLKFIYENELEEYIKNGWKRGRLHFKHKQKSFYIHKNDVVKKVKEDILDDFLNKGWKRGKIKRENKYVTKDELIELLHSKTFTDIAKMFGVSRALIRSWCKNYGLTVKSRDYKKKIS